MNKTFNNSFWTGATLIGFVVLLLIALIWGATEITKDFTLRQPSQPNVIHDTIYVEVEVIKEVQVTKEVEKLCNLKHVTTQITQHVEAEKNDTIK